ncbi:hypothetical protein EJ02DRAFT_440078 [Clathrospora elynae]|uniref:Uncharacterized protein n=1 Tax=Clathrospora elynae TaxID=706981 RepID=A0A6A5T720_9PLEO|nr:hypothetical protein EJ02DRAFT_440078 [Clathrospora elynae]
MGAPDSAAQPGADWDEAQCTAALAQLEQVQAQLNDLRLAIPRIIEPLHRPANPTTYRLYSQGVIGSQNGVNNLKVQWKTPEIQSTFAHVKKSFDANADLSESASIPSYGWTERAQRAKDSKKSKGGESVEDLGATLTDEAIGGIVVEFRKTHPNIKLETQDDNRSISTRFVSGSVLLKFRINIEHEANGRHKLSAECLGTTEPFLAVTRSIASRPQANDLKSLLDMIAAYKTVKGKSCANCGGILDKAMMIPTARRSKKVASANESPETVWEAFHESCLG